jgi:hypothetical protein
VHWLTRFLRIEIDSKGIRDGVSPQKLLPEAFSFFPFGRGSEDIFMRLDT